MFEDFLQLQKELPPLQETGINPHFKNRYIPLEELISKVLPVLHKNNFVLMQMPTLMENQPALMIRLLHKDGEVFEATMPLSMTKTDPQAQGSAITYARRYSLMAMLGLVADKDDDGEAARVPRQAGEPTKPGEIPDVAITPKQQKYIFVLLKEAGITETDDQRRFLLKETGRNSTSNLTMDDARQLIEKLQAIINLKGDPNGHEA